MNSYKINLIYHDQNDINEILIKVLKKELQNYIKRVSKTNNVGVSLKKSLSLQNKDGYQ